MKNLGKIFLVLYILAGATLFAKVTASLEPPVIYTGELATYKLTITGGEINKPLIDSLCGEDILSTSSATNIEMINGNYSKSYVLSYQFMPKHDCTIAPIKVEVDGAMEQSNAVKVVVRPPSQDKHADFVLSLQTSKHEVYVGEPFTLTLTLKQKLRASMVDSKFIAPDFKGFWVKGESEPKRVQNGEYIITTKTFTLAAQREGNVSIPSAQLRIAQRVNTQNSWGMFMPNVKWKSYFSNTVSMVVKPLPNNAKIVGDFTLSAVADKTKIHSNEVVNVTVRVQGNGNLEDITSFKPYVPNVNVFEEKIKIQGNTLTQKLAFVADNNFTIPPFHLDYYDLKTHKVRRIKTQPIQITVEGMTQAPQALKIKREDNTQASEEKSLINGEKKLSVTQNDSISKVWVIVALVIGFILGIGVMVLKNWKFATVKNEFNPKDEKRLLMKLLPYKESDNEVRQIVEILEKNLYEGAQEKLDKKLVKEVIKRYKIV